MPTLGAPGPRPWVEGITRRSGAHPAALVALLAGLLLAVVALRELLEARTIDVGTWFLAAAILHDAAFLPAYIAADALLVMLWRRAPGKVAWLNFVRFPAAISGMLLLAYSSTILRLSDGSFETKTQRSDEAYLSHWLFVTAVLAVVSAACYLARLVVVSRADRGVSAP